MSSPIAVYAFREPPPQGDVGVLDLRLVYLGDDADGRPLEVMAVETAGDELLVIHAMPLRDKYKPQYEEARKWRR